MNKIHDNPRLKGWIELNPNQYELVRNGKTIAALDRHGPDYAVLKIQIKTRDLPNSSIELYGNGTSDNTDVNDILETATNQVNQVIQDTIDYLQSLLS